MELIKVTLVERSGWSEEESYALYLNGVIQDQQKTRPTLEQGMNLINGKKGQLSFEIRYLDDSYFENFPTFPVFLKEIENQLL